MANESGNRSAGDGARVTAGPLPVDPQRWQAANAWAGPQWPETGPHWPPTTGPVAPEQAIPPGDGIGGRRDARHAPADDGPRGLPARALWLLLPGALAAVVLASVGSAIGSAVTGSTKSAVTVLLGEVGLWAGMVATAALASRQYGSSSLRRDYGLSLKAPDILWGLLALGSALVVSTVVLTAFSGTQLAGKNDQIITQQEGHTSGLVVVAIVVALGAPFFEELFFRGFLRTALQSWTGPHAAVFLQAALFGLAHVGEAKGLGNVSVGVAMFGVGVVLGYTAKFTRRLGAGMLAHGLFNLLAVIAAVA